MKTTKGGARRCTTEKDIRELIHLIDNFKFSGVEIQQSRLLQLSDMSSALNNENARQRVIELKESQDRVNQRLEQLQKDMENQIATLGQVCINWYQFY